MYNCPRLRRPVKMDSKHTYRCAVALTHRSDRSAVGCDLCSIQISADANVADGIFFSRLKAQGPRYTKAHWTHPARQPDIDRAAHWLRSCHWDRTTTNQDRQ